ncbi:hypothetical protein VD659_02290 [Herbiconiux sp. 11R-BC]|uniref:hypothetical protein n=1 Tax=Herbiconiux sp. 11R-BC TaxID=3111637 RepID=UPI0010F4F076
MKRARVALIDRRPPASRRRHPAPALVNALDRRPSEFEVAVRSSSSHGPLPVHPAIDLAVVFVDSTDADHNHDVEIDAIASEVGLLVAIDVAHPVTGRLAERWPHAAAHLSSQASTETIMLVLTNLVSQASKAPLQSA